MSTVSSKPRSAIVVSDGVNALGIVRSLGKMGVRPYLLTASENGFIARSRFVRSAAIVDTGNDDALWDGIEGFGQPGAVIIAGTDQYMAFLLRRYSQLSPRYALYMPDSEVFLTLVDKKKELECILRLGIPMPKSVTDLNENALGKLQFPVIVKPRSFEYLSELGAKNRILASRADFEALESTLGESLSNYVAQEVIGGGDEKLWVCNCTFGSDFELVSSFVFQRIRTTPPHFGVTSFAISRKNDTIREYVAAIGRRLRYKGPAMFEFKLDPRDKEFKYIEINPRLGMCNYFDTFCGVNNVYNTYCLAAGLKVAPQREQLDGRIFVNLLPDVKARLRDGESVYAILRSYLKYARNPRVGAFWAPGDPVPGLLWTASRLSRVFG